jgi:hypothetical protein
MIFDKVSLNDCGAGGAEGGGSTVAWYVTEPPVSSVAATTVQPSCG